MKPKCLNVGYKSFSSQTVVDLDKIPIGFDT
jgi:hypothetical protein